jgi:hypothetical protein
VIVQHDRRRGRADLDDRTAALHGGNDRLIEHERALELQVHDLVEIGFAVLEEWREQAPASGVHGDIDRPILLPRERNEFLQIGFRCDVSGAGGASDCLRKPVQLVFLAAGHHDLGAFGSKSLRDVLTHIVPARCAENDRCLPI